MSEQQPPRAKGVGVPRMGSTSLDLTIGEVLPALESLYKDELKPFGRLLLKRIRERAAAKAAKAQGLDPDDIDPETMPRIDPKRLRRVCESCRSLFVERESGREYSVMLMDRPCHFLDVCSPLDPYPQGLWLHVGNYFSSLNKQEMVFPGGRYACARVLVRRRLPFLEGHSLGQVCHIVQLAISQKRILGYKEGQLVPYLYSEDWIKEQCAFSHSSLSAGDLPVASWEDTRMCLLELLDSTMHSAEPGVITISNVKRLFRSRFHLELSETVLGRTRLFDVLNDPYFQDICVVESQGDGQVVVRRRYCHLPQIDIPPPGVWFLRDPATDWRDEQNDQIGGLRDTVMGGEVPMPWPAFASEFGASLPV